MSFFDDWIGRIGLVYFAWPILIMLAYVVWNSFKADTIRGLLTGLAAVLMFAVIALIFWIIGSFIVGAILAVGMNLIGLEQIWIQSVVVAAMAVAMILGAVLGWRYLDEVLGSDARRWKL